LAPSWRLGHGTPLLWGIHAQSVLMIMQRTIATRLSDASRWHSENLSDGLLALSFSNQECVFRSDTLRIVLCIPDRACLGGLASENRVMNHGGPKVRSVRLNAGTGGRDNVTNFRCGGPSGRPCARWG
jgi:hypothetical protein